MQLTILGGGPAGLGVATYAHQAGHRFTLYEGSAELGGMCRTFHHGKHRYDAGAHRFHDQDADITKDFLKLMGGELRRISAPSKLWDHGKFIDFPPTPLNAAFSFGFLGAGRIAVEMLRARLSTKPCVNFGDFARRQFGEFLARRMLIDYSEKLWGLPADKLSPDIATRRLKGMTLRSLFVELFSPSRKTTHIDGDFLYPAGGYGEIPIRLAAGLPADSLVTLHEIVRLECDADSVVRVHFKNGRTAAVGDRVISTLPLTLLVRLLGDRVPRASHEAAGRLRFRHLRLVFLRLNKPRVSENASIYIPSPDFKVSRVYEPKNRSAQMAPANETSLVAEIPYFTGDKVDATADDILAALVVDELDQIKLIGRNDVLEWRVHQLPFAYPVYGMDYAREVATIKSGLEPLENLDTLGRAGNFFYSHLHDQLRLSKDYVASIGAASERRVALCSGSDEMNDANLSL